MGCNLVNLSNLLRELLDTWIAELDQAALKLRKWKFMNMYNDALSLHNCNTIQFLVWICFLNWKISSSSPQSSKFNGKLIICLYCSNKPCQKMYCCERHGRLLKKKPWKSTLMICVGSRQYKCMCCALVHTVNLENILWHGGNY